MQLKLFLNSASELKNVNWRNGHLQPYAIAWIDSSGKCSTKVDVNNGENPVWNEKFTITFPATSHPATAIINIDVVHAKPDAATKPLVGSAKLPFKVALNEVLSKGKALFSLILERPSGRPQGSLEIQIEIKDLNINQSQPYGQAAPNMPPYQTQPQPRPMHQYPQGMPHPQHRPQLINQYSNTPVSTRPKYPVNVPQNFSPTLAQQRANAMLLARRKQAQSSLLGDALCLAVGVNPTPIKRMVGTFQRYHALDNRIQGSNTGMVNYDDGSGNDGQFNTDGGFGDGGIDMSGGGFDMGGGFDLGGLDMGGLDLGGLDLSGLSM